MRTADIMVGEEYACALRALGPGRVVECGRVVARRRGEVDITVGRRGHEFHHKNLLVRHVLRPWAEEQRARDLAQLKRDAQEAQQRAYEASRDAVILHFAEAFRGLDVQPDGTSTHERPDVDLADRLIETFALTRSLTASCEWAVFEAIARRILELNELARQNALVGGDDAGGWSA